MIIDNIQKLVKEFPFDLQQEVEDFTEYLLEKKLPKTKNDLKLDWRGALKDKNNQYTSVELQHKSLDWWNEKCT